MNITYKYPKQLKPLSLGILMALGSSAASADIILTHRDNTASDVAGTASLYTCNTVPTDFIPGSEFRMCDPNGSLGGGAPVQKDTVNGGETWTFDTSNNMSATAGMPNTAGIMPSYTAPYPGSSADPTGGPAMDQGANFFGALFSFLAPIVGSNAGTAYGVGTATIDAVAGTITLNFPVLEAQWGGVFFPLGQASGGITFTGPITVVGSSGGLTTFDYKISAEELIDVAEDPNGAGFSNWSAQWLYSGTGTAPDAIFTTLPQSPIASSGAIGPTPGGPGVGNTFNDGRITLAESEAAFGVDTGADKPNGINNPCTGGCFDFTVTGIAGASEQVILPLTSPIPSDPVYRKYKNGSWGDFDTSTGDTIESGLSTVTPVDCTTVTAWSPGLAPGHNCVRLTIADGGVNDLDGIADTKIVDPGGVASAPPADVDTSRPPQTIDDAEGCSVTTRSVSPIEKADWFIVAAFLAYLGIRRKYKNEKS